MKINFGEKVPPSVKSVVSKPLGRIYSQKGIISMLRRNRISSKKLIVVGDITGAFLIENKIRPAIWIYDGTSRRKKVKYTLPIPTHIVKNPRGHITHPLRAAIDDTLKNHNGRIYVQGQEDLAALYVMSKAKGWLMLYGQPMRGIVAVKIGIKEQKIADSLLSMLV